VILIAGFASILRWKRAFVYRDTNASEVVTLEGGDPRNRRKDAPLLSL